MAKKKSLFPSSGVQVKKFNPDTALLNNQMVFDTEIGLLGGALVKEEAITELFVENLFPEIFTTEPHQLICQAILSLAQQLKLIDIDILQVMWELRRQGNLEKVGGPQYITMLSRRGFYTFGYEAHIAQVTQEYIRRISQEVLKNAAQKVRDPSEDVMPTLAEVEQQLNEILEQKLKKVPYQTLGEALQTKKAVLENPASMGAEEGVPSGIIVIDALTGGWKKGELIIIGARPGMGKTSLLLNFAINAAKRGHRIAFFSLEMSTRQLVDRVLSYKTKLPIQKIHLGKRLPDKDYKELIKAIDSEKNLPIFIDDTPGLSTAEIQSRSKRLKARHNIELVIIDYLQLLVPEQTRNSNYSNITAEVSVISKALKNMSRLLDLPVIVACQLNRAVETRGGDKKPQLSDLRDSGTIEQDANIVGFLYRPEYYGITEKDGKSTDGLAELIIAKNRDGSCETIKLRYEIEHFSFLSKFEKE